MDYQGQERNDPAEAYRPAPSQDGKKPQNALATASLVMGILALLTCCCCYGGMIFGGLGIIFALLSRGDGPLSGQAKTGMILSVIGLLLGVAAMAVMLGVGLLEAGEMYQELPEIQEIPAVPEMPFPETLRPDNLLVIWKHGKLGGGF